MEILMTKTQILTIFFIILFNQLLPIVSATQTQKSPPKQAQPQPQTNQNQNQPQQSSSISKPQIKGQPAAKGGQNDQINGNQSDKSPKPTPSETWSQQDFVTAHNEYRQKLGHPPLIWDENLAVFARWWANMRRGDCEIVHSRKEYGENIFRGQHDGQWTPAEVVEKWEEEEKFYDRKSDKCDEEKQCGHYTQVIWSTTERIGCGQKKCNNGSLIVVCSYDPPGNVEGSSPFASPQKSSPASGSSSRPPTAAPSINPNSKKSKKKHG